MAESPRRNHGVSQVNIAKSLFVLLTFLLVVTGQDLAVIAEEFKVNSVFRVNS